MAYIIAEPCIGVKDRSCVEVCPVDCIHPKTDEDKDEAYMSLPGYLPYLSFQRLGNWLTYTQATHVVQEERGL